ncbi:mur ligase middle domain protein [Mycobacterium ulcerans str. Harvey]|uniref:Mur ligase middle domain protein n=1 Tax=Mycobacterium ulcerans str. Harvey TaxID=1299332 RepID=A0ABN0QT30_MYCUL|nr:mur ligase middle domain protein [Mycobacterium ulcerans str. Harvey]
MAAELMAGGLTIIGITGSSGKTSTKDLVAAVLKPLGEVVAPPGSFNNELGHPWTVLRATRSTDYLILEMSARHPGNIAALARVAPPAIGVVLNVGTAHLGSSVHARSLPKPNLSCRKPSRHPGWSSSTRMTRLWRPWPR